MKRRFLSSVVQGVHSHAAPVERARGFRDVLPREAALVRLLEGAFFAATAGAGYRELSTPLVEAAPLYARTLGAASDVVAKETFAVSPAATPSGAREGAPAAASAPLVLRPEGTAGVLRALLSSGLAGVPGVAPARVAYAGPMFRHERPQRGRYRQFTQLGVELVGGCGGVAQDVESIALADALLRQVLPTQSGGGGASGGHAPRTPSLRLRLLINSLGSGTGPYCAALSTYLAAHMHVLSPESRARVERGAVLRVLDSKAPCDAAVLAGAPVLSDFASPPDAARFAAVQRGLTLVGVPYELAPRLVRGLDYYSHTIFEFVVEEEGEGRGGLGQGPLGTVLAGGRYDRLSALLGARSHVPCIGWAAGLERLMLLTHLDAERLEDRPFTVAILPVLRPSPPQPDAAAEPAFTPPSVEEAAATALAHALRAASPQLRDEDGRRALPSVVLQLTASSSIKRLIADAAAAGADAAVIVAPDELAQGSVGVKDLVQRTQVVVPVAGLLAWSAAAAGAAVEPLRADACASLVEVLRRAAAAVPRSKDVR